ncbi:MAG: hypothetical protein K2K76_10190, partial [Muribaculaceae bacterium]|nr:hypothetical protein [Muribaculaceae bacterium]
MKELTQYQAELAGDILNGVRPLCSAAEMLGLLDAAPYLSSLALVWLRRSCEEHGEMADDSQIQEDRRAVARKAVAAMPVQPSDALYRLAGLVQGEPDNEPFYPPAKTQSTPTTTDTIDKFLSTYTSSDREEVAMIEKLIFNPVPDYASVLAEQESHSLPEPDEAPAGSADALINSFILKNHDKDAPRIEPEATDVASRPLVVPPPVADGRPVTPPPPPRDDSTLRESLAIFYIKRKLYRQAYELIEHLNLIYPEKNIYFAPQLRFLAKLIANEEAR